MVTKVVNVSNFDKCDQNVKLTQNSGEVDVLPSQAMYYFTFKPRDQIISHNEKQIGDCDCDYPVASLEVNSQGLVYDSA